jgi:hypothetical protein
MLSNFRIGDRVVSNAIEDDFLVGTVVYTGLEKARVAWPDGTNSTERYQDLVLVRESGSTHPKFLGLFEGPQLHDEDIPKEYQQLLVDQKIFKSEGLEIHDNITLRAFWDAKQRFEEQQIAKSLLTNEVKLPSSSVDYKFGHRTIGSERKDWEPGDIVSVSRPGKNAGKLATAHILRVTPYEADLIWVDPLTKQEIETRESLNNLIFVRHDAAWRATKEKTQRLEAERFRSEAIGLDTTDFYGFNDIGYPTQLIPDPLMYDLRFQEKRVRDYVWEKTQQHPVGDNELSEYNLKELQYGGVTQGFQPFHGFERFADYLWR